VANQATRATRTKKTVADAATLKSEGLSEHKNTEAGTVNVNEDSEVPAKVKATWAKTEEGNVDATEAMATISTPIGEIVTVEADGAEWCQSQILEIVLICFVLIWELVEHRLDLSFKQAAGLKREVGALKKQFKTHEPPSVPVLSDNMMAVAAGGFLETTERAAKAKTHGGSAHAVVGWFEEGVPAVQVQIGDTNCQRMVETILAAGNVVRKSAAPARGKAAARKPATEKEKIARASEDGVVVFLFVERTLTAMLEDCIAAVKFVARSLAAASWGLTPALILDAWFVRVLILWVPFKLVCGCFEDVLEFSGGIVGCRSVAQICKLRW
jgi:hypothetical protein